MAAERPWRRRTPRRRSATASTPVRPSPSRSPSTRSTTPRSGTDKTVTILEDGSHAFAAADFGFSDSIDGNALLNIRITSVPANGTLKLSGSDVTAPTTIPVASLGFLVFAPDADENGNDYATLPVRRPGRRRHRERRRRHRPVREHHHPRRHRRERRPVVHRGCRRERPAGLGRPHRHRLGDRHQRRPVRRVRPAPRLPAQQHEQRPVQRPAGGLAGRRPDVHPGRGRPRRRDRHGPAPRRRRRDRRRTSTSARRRRSRSPCPRATSAPVTTGDELRDRRGRPPGRQTCGRRRASATTAGRRRDPLDAVLDHRRQQACSTWTRTAVHRLRPGCRLQRLRLVHRTRRTTAPATPTP